MIWFSTTSKASSTAIWILFGFACILFAIQTIAPHVSTAARTMYMTALLIDKSIPATLIEIHGSRKNSFCGWNSSFLPSLPKMM